LAGLTRLGEFVTGACRLQRFFPFLAEDAPSLSLGRHFVTSFNSD